MANIINVPVPPVVLTTEQLIAKQIDTEIKNAATAQKKAYDIIRNLIFGNTKKPKTIAEINFAYAAFAANTTTGLTIENLQDMACLAKTTINRYQPGTIVDNVPELIITYPTA